MSQYESFRDLDLDDEWARLRADLIEQEQLAIEALRPFETPGWDQLRPVIQAALDSETANLIHAKFTAEQLWQTRGRVQGFQWLLGQKAELEQHVRMIRDALNEHEREGTPDVPAQ